MHTAAFIRKCLTGIALTLLLPPLAASAQPGNARKTSASESGASQTYRLFTGRVEDAATGKPLSYASVSLLHSTLSNIANSEGVFTLKIPDAGSGAEDSLLVSHLGYRSRKVPAGAAGGRRPAVIRLEPSSISLNTITIRPEEALRLFQLAFSERKIRENYPQQTRGLT